MSRKEYYGYEAANPPIEEDHHNKILLKRLQEAKFSKLGFNADILGTDADKDNRHWSRCLAGMLLDILEVEKFNLLVLRDTAELKEIEKTTIFSCGCCAFENPFYKDIDKRLEELKVLKQKIVDFSKRTGKKDFDFHREYEIISNAINETSSK